MASRLTTNQEIAGSTPAVVIVFFLGPHMHFNTSFIDLFAMQPETITTEMI